MFAAAPDAGRGCLFKHTHPLNAAVLPHCLAAGVKGRRIRELTSVVQKRFKFPEGSVELYAEKVGGGLLHCFSCLKGVHFCFSSARR